MDSTGEFETAFDCISEVLDRAFAGGVILREGFRALKPSRRITPPANALSKTSEMQSNAVSNSPVESIDSQSTRKVGQRPWPSSRAELPRPWYGSPEAAPANHR